MDTETKKIVEKVTGTTLLNAEEVTQLEKKFQDCATAAATEHIKNVNDGKVPSAALNPYGLGKSVCICKYALPEEAPVSFDRGSVAPTQSRNFVPKRVTNPACREHGTPDLSPEDLDLKALRLKAKAATQAEVLQMDKVWRTLSEEKKAETLGISVDELQESQAQEARASKESEMLKTLIQKCEEPTTIPKPGLEDYAYRYSNAEKLKEMTNELREYLKVIRELPPDQVTRLARYSEPLLKGYLAGMAELFPKVEGWFDFMQESKAKEAKTTMEEVRALFEEYKTFFRDNYSLNINELLEKS